MADGPGTVASLDALPSGVVDDGRPPHMSVPSGELLALRSHAFERLNACAVLLDGAGVIVDTNEAWRLFANLNDGTPSGTGAGVNYLDVCAHAAAQGDVGAAEIEAGLGEILAGDRAHFDVEYPCDSPTEERWFRLQASSAPVSGGSGVVLLHVDITASRLRETQLRDQAERDTLTGLPNRDGARRHLATFLAEGTPTTVLFLDLDGFKSVNDTYGHHTGDELLAKVSSRLRRGVRSDDVVCRQGGDEFVVICRDLGPEQARSMTERLVEVMNSPFQVGANTVRVGASIGRARSAPGSTVESMLRTADAQMYVAKARRRRRKGIDPTRPERSQGQPPAGGAIGAAHRLHDRAHVPTRHSLVDELTQLSNMNGLTQAIGDAQAASGPAATVGLVLFDLDDFSDVNDTLGHGGGDALLVVIARRVREAMPSEFVVARVGGHQFAVFGHVPSGAPACHGIASAVRGALTDAVRIDGHELVTSATLGLAVAPGDRAGDLMRDADAALSHAKRTDRGGAVIFDPKLVVEATRRLRRTSDLRRAISLREIVPHYQPVIELATGRVVAVEALARWPHARHGWVAPDEFIPLAETNGLIEALGQQIIERACIDAAEWLRQGRRLQLAVNASGVQLSKPSFLATIDAALGAAGLPASQLTVEVTETAAVSEPATALAVLRSLNDRAIVVSLDDFGTGYSPLAALRDLPVTAVKLDRSFVAGLGSVTNDGLVAGIIQLGLAVGAYVVAEGVQTQAQAVQLSALGCRYGQGYLWSPAVPGEELLATVDRIEQHSLCQRPSVRA